MKYSLCLCLMLLVGLGCASQSAEIRGIQEASGLAKVGDEILVVGDEDAGTYFRYKLPADGEARIPLEPDRLKPEEWAGLPIVIDQEAIDLLADGRIAILSERLRSIIGEEGLIAEYPHFVAESGNRGLEGLAIRDLEDGSSRVAAVWEGGYPRYHALPHTIQEKAGRLSMKPVLLMHDIEPGGAGYRLRPSQLHVREFEVPRPPGEEPTAQRFRCPALVWHRFERAGQEEWGFILLLSSECSLQPEPGSPEDCGSSKPGREGERYCYKYLQKFDREGLPVGDPLDLDDFFPPDIAPRNWEGMDWYEEGESLILIYEEDAAVEGSAYVVELPEGW